MLSADVVFPVMSALRIAEQETSGQETTTATAQTQKTAATKSKIVVTVGTKQSSNLYVAVLPSCVSPHQPQGMDSEEVGARELQWQQIVGAGKGTLEW